MLIPAQTVLLKVPDIIEELVPRALFDRHHVSRRIVGIRYLRFRLRVQPHVVYGKNRGIKRTGQIKVAEAKENLEILIRREDVSQVSRCLRVASLGVLPRIDVAKSVVFHRGFKFEVVQEIVVDRADKRSRHRVITGIV